MATIKSYSDLKQSKILSKILSDESADMKWVYVFGQPFLVPVNNKMNENEEPCWSLSALLSVLPELQGSKPIITLDDNYITYPHMSGLHTKADNLIDACYEMIIKLHELKML